MPNPVTREEFDAALRMVDSTTEWCCDCATIDVDDCAYCVALANLTAYADQQKAALDFAIMKLGTANERIKLDAETIKAQAQARDAKNTHE